MSETAILHDAVDTLREENRKLRARLESNQREIEQLNLELDETNRGVVALYAELDDKAHALREASELKSRFLSYMSHEFRTPLGAIRSMTRLLFVCLVGSLCVVLVLLFVFFLFSVLVLSVLVND